MWTTEKGRGTHAPSYAGLATGYTHTTGSRRIQSAPQRPNTRCRKTNCHAFNMLTAQRHIGMSSRICGRSASIIRRPQVYSLGCNNKFANNNLLMIKKGFKIQVNIFCQQCGPTEQQFICLKLVYYFSVFKTKFIAEYVKLNGKRIYRVAQKSKLLTQYNSLLF